jgi:hypothetical protein
LLTSAILVLVAVSYAPAASAADPGSFPTVTIELLPDSSGEVLAAQGAFQATENARALTRPGVDMNRFPENPPRPWHWYRAASHSLLATVLPGTSFYLAETQGKYCRGVWLQDDWARIVAIREGKSYLLPDDLGRLLYDAGMKFEKSDVPVWMNVGAVVWACVHRYYLLGTWWDAIPPSRRGETPFVPALTFDSLHFDTTGRDPLAFHTVYMRVAGKGIELHVSSTGEWLSDSGGKRKWIGLVPYEFIPPNDRGRNIDVRPVETGLLDDSDSVESGPRTNGDTR